MSLTLKKYKEKIQYDEETDQYFMILQDKYFTYFVGVLNNGRIDADKSSMTEEEKELLPHLSLLVTLGWEPSPKDIILAKGICNKDLFEDFRKEYKRLKSLDYDTLKSSIEVGMQAGVEVMKVFDGFVKVRISDTALGNKYSYEAIESVVYRKYGKCPNYFNIMELSRHKMHWVSEDFAEKMDKEYFDTKKARRISDQITDEQFTMWINNLMYGAGLDIIG